MEDQSISAVSRKADWLQTAGLVLLSILLIARFAQIHATHPLGPDSVLPASAWFGWADQAAYFLAAHGWWSGDLSAAHHVYPDGYALLAAPFCWLMPDEPFYVPNLLCWLASLWLFAGLAVHLGRGWAGTRLAGGLVFFLVTVAGTRAFYTWEVPWTSTPAATLTFAAWLAAMRLAKDGGVRWAAAAAAAAGGLVLFRPTDALVVGTGVGLFLAWAILRQPRPIRPLAAAACAYCAGPLLLLWTHWLIHGWTLGYYFELSRLIGFEWRLLPIRWVTLVLGPQPLFRDGAGLGSLFPYVLPGMAGVAACVLAPGPRLRHALVGGTAIVFLCLYLCYRDLHVMGLARFMNYHYFKWTLPLFGLYALNLLHMLAIERRWQSLLAVATVLLLCCWRVELAADAAPAPAMVSADGHALILPDGLPHVDQAVVVQAPDDFLAIYFGPHTGVSGDKHYLGGADFKLTPIPFGMVLTPLRPLPGPLRVELADTLRLDPTSPVLAKRQRIVFALPCPILPKRAACRYRDPWEPPQ